MTTVDKHIDKQAVISAANGRWVSVFRELAPDLSEAVDAAPRHVCCPLPEHEDRNPSFRFDNLDEGDAICTCGSFGGFALLMTLNGWSFAEALQAVAEQAGVTPDINGRAKIDILQAVATAKRMPLDSMKAFGAKAAKRGKLECVRFPVYNADGDRHSYFDLVPDGKGWFKKGKGNAGLFFPGQLPQEDETWLVVEGPKDAVALHGLGFLACGLNKDEMAVKYARLFQGVSVVVVPDRTRDAEGKAQKSAARLYGVAKSVRVATLPLEIAIDSDAPNDVRDVLRRPDGEALLRKAIDDAREWIAPKLNNEIPDARTAEGQTDIANAKRLIRLHGENVRYVGPWGKWITFDDKRWLIDDMARVETLAKDVSDNLFHRLITSGVPANSKAMKFAVATAKMSGIRNMISAARGEVAIHHSRLNRHPMLFNVQNGTLDLETGELRRHARGDFLTQVAPVKCDVNADCPRWLSFLEEIMGGNQELVRFLRRLVGYALTGAIREHVLPILFGTGANGKSVFITTLQNLMGEDYAVQAPTGMLMLKKYESHPTEIAGLFAKRFVAAVETEGGNLISETLVKQLTGGDRLTARRMREDFWTFTPSHKIWLATNHKPSVHGTDEGIWRRLRLVPFNVTIPDSKKDLTLSEKHKGELPGILNWALQGCREWQEHGLDEPAEVTDATREYRHESDYLGGFIEECCLVGPGCQVRATSLFDAFKDWGGKWTQTKFGTEVAARFMRDRDGVGRKIYLGVGLTEVN